MVIMLFFQPLFAFAESGEVLPGVDNEMVSTFDEKEGILEAVINKEIEQIDEEFLKSWGVENEIKDQILLPKLDKQEEKSQILDLESEKNETTTKNTWAIENIKGPNGTPELMITEIYFQGNDERIELTNISEEQFEWVVEIDYGTKNPKKLTISAIWWGSVILGKNKVIDASSLSLFEETFQLVDSKAIAIKILVNSEVLDSFFVDTGTVTEQKDKKTSFEKIEENWIYSIVPTNAERTKNMQSGYFWNPGVAFDFGLEEEPEDPELSEEPVINSWDQTKLVITEAFFDMTNTWIEISNTGTGDYSGDIILSGIGQNNQLFRYTAMIPAQSSFVFAENGRYFTGNFLKDITNDEYFLNRNSGLHLTLSYWSGQQDQLIVHPERTQFLEGKEQSFEKVLLDGNWLTTRTSLDRRKNMNGDFIANPGVYFTEAENAKDISQPKNDPIIPSQIDIELPITCSAFNDRYRLEIQEIFWGNSVYHPFIELRRTDSPTWFSFLRLTGSVLEKEILLEKSDVWELNKTFLVGKDEFWNDKGIDSDFSSDFWLLNTTWYLMVEWLKGQNRQVLDMVILTGWTVEKSKYFWGEKEAWCFPVFDQEGDFSPGFDRKFLEYFQIDTEPKIEYIKVWWGGGWGSYSCPSKEDLCPAKQPLEKKEKSENVIVEDEIIENKEEQKEDNTWILDLENFTVKIEHIDYDPPGNDKDKESITIILTKGKQLDLSKLTLNINGKNKKIKGILNEGVSQTFVGNFSFPNSSKTNDAILVQLKYKDTVLDNYYYKLSSQKKEEKGEENLKDGVKVFSVLDGDTLRYRDEEGKLQSVRLLWVDAPESNTARFKKTECYGKESKEFLNEKLKGKNVQISFDNGEVKLDRYWRLLAYVWFEGKLINEELISKGYAKEYTYKEDYQEQEKFQKAEKSAQLAQLWMRNSWNCPLALEQDLESRENAEQLVIKITDIDYDPTGSDKDNESITLSIFNKNEGRKTIDFENQFWFFIFENTGTGFDFSFEEIEEWTGKKFKDLSFLGVQELKNPLVLKGDFQLPNSKSSCIALVQKEHLFDIACYDVKKKEMEEKENTDLLTGVSLKILSLTPNPKGKDNGKEKIELLFDKWKQNIQTLNLGSGFYLLINGKTKKQLSWSLETGKSKLLEGNFNFPNSSSCISIGKGDQIFDTFCYGNSKDGLTYKKNNETLVDFDREELQIIKGSSLVKIGNKHCISYRNEIFSCRAIPNSRTEEEKKWKTKAQIWESTFVWIEELLKTEYRPWYEDSEVKSYFQLARNMKDDMKNNQFTTKVWGKTFEWKLFKEVFEKKRKLSIFDNGLVFLKQMISPTIINSYEKKKTERLKNLPDTL